MTSSHEPKCAKLENRSTNHYQLCSAPAVDSCNHSAAPESFYPSIRSCGQFVLRHCWANLLRRTNRSRANKNLLWALPLSILPARRVSKQRPFLAERRKTNICWKLLVAALLFMTMTTMVGWTFLL